MYMGVRGVGRSGFHHFRVFELISILGKTYICELYCLKLEGTIRELLGSSHHSLVNDAVLDLDQPNSDNQSIKSNFYTDLFLAFVLVPTTNVCLQRAININSL